MRIPRWVVAPVFVLVAIHVTAEEPKPTSLTESVEKRLVQLDVAVEGDRDAIRALTAKDFALYVGEHPIQGLILDRLCGEEASKTDQVREAPEPPALPQVARPRATFVFFFDQTHLTMAGRAHSLEISRDLINRLIVDGNRASIVSDARRLETLVPMTDDREKLLAGLERLRVDPRQWDTYAATEEIRAREILSARSKACLLAKFYAREEYQIARQTTQRLALALGRLTTASPPRALVYFGDTLRQRAGLHFRHLVLCDGPFRETTMAELIPSAATEFDALTAEATARGVHFFTIQAEGLRPYEVERHRVPMATLGRLPAQTGGDRHRQAQDTLVALAAETGGEAFLGGASNEHIADRIESLTSCRLLLSFPPGNLPLDTAMNLTLVVNAPKVRIQTQGRMVVPSAESIERARLTAAFVDPGSSDDGSLRALLIPRGGDGKTWNASVQLRLRPTGLPDNSAELGASVVRRDKVTEHFAASIATPSPKRSMVLEKGVVITPGEFSIVAVARDSIRGDLGATRLEANWPIPTKDAAAIAPIAVVQTGPAAMSKDGTGSSSGALALDNDEAVDSSKSVTLMSVVCRGPNSRLPIIVERWIQGGSTDEFAPLTIAETDEPCRQTVDVVAAGRLQPGIIDFRIVARAGEEIIAQERRALRVESNP